MTELQAIRFVQERYPTAWADNKRPGVVHMVKDNRVLACIHRVDSVWSVKFSEKF